MITLSRLGLVAVAVAAGVTVLAVGPAKADVFQLTSDHCTGGCLGDLTSGGTVTVTQAGTNTLDFSIALASGFTIINTGFDGNVPLGVEMSGGRCQCRPKRRLPS
jgi:hypothetical protein